MTARVNVSVLVALVLALLLSAASVWMYPFWWCAPQERAALVFLFFQTVSIVGGLFLLASHGPGRFSVAAVVSKEA